MIKIFLCFLLLIDSLNCIAIHSLKLKKIAITGIAIQSLVFPINLADAKESTNFALQNTLSDSQSEPIDDFSRSSSLKKWNQLNIESPLSPKNRLASSTTYISIDRNNIYFNGPITFESCIELRKKIIELDELGKIYRIEYKTDPPPINLHIQSLGGTLLNSLYIVDLIKNSETPINTYIDGYSASAATLITVVGKKRYMTKNSLMLIHQLSGGNEGKFDEMDDEFKNLNLYMKLIKEIYLTNSKISPLILDDILKHDIWLSSDQCKELGLIDEII